MSPVADDVLRVADYYLVLPDFIFPFPHTDSSFELLMRPHPIALPAPYGLPSSFLPPSPLTAAHSARRTMNGNIRLLRKL